MQSVRKPRLFKLLRVRTASLAKLNVSLARHPARKPMLDLSNKRPDKWDHYLRLGKL